MMFVYGLTIIITGLWKIRMVSAGKLIFKRTPLDLPLGLFLLSQIISTILSIDSHTSLWGYYSRSNGGLLSSISYILLYYAFVSNIQKEDILKFLKTAVFSGGLAALYAIPEHFGVSPSCVFLTGEFNALCWIQDVQARVFGTLGQPNWLAALLAMLIFPAIYFYISAKTFFSKTCYLLLITCYYLAFTFTYSRGAALGLIAGFAVLVTSQLLASHLKGVKLNFTNLKPLGIVIGIFLLINLLFGSALTEFKLLREPAVPLRPGITQTSGTQLENGGTESGKIRLIVWKGALEIFKAYPLFGSGVETFAYSYYQFRPNEHNLVSEWDFLYNKAHNEYLNYLATTGLFGFLTYISVIITFIVLSIKYYVLSLKNKSLNTSPLILIPSLLAGYISYLVQNFFLFSVVSISVLFYLFPAFAFVYTQSAKELSGKNFISSAANKILELINRKNIYRKIVSGLLILIILVFLYSLYSLWKADTYYKDGSQYNDSGNPGRAYNALIEAVKRNPKEPLYLSELGYAAASSSLALSPEDATTSGELKEDAIFFTDLALSQSGVNTTIQRTAIRTFFELSLSDPSLEPKTIQVINNAIALSPTDPKLYHNKGIILGQFNQLNEAIKSVKIAVNLKPNYRDARLSLADLYIKNNQKELAQEELDTVLKQIPGDPDALKLQEEIK